MADLTDNQTTQQLTTAVENAPASTQRAIMGASYTPNSKQLVTIEDVRKVADNLKMDDWKNIVTPILINKILTSDFTTFKANNPFEKFIKGNSPWGNTKEHIVTMFATIVNLIGDNDKDMDNEVLTASFKGKDNEPSTLDWMNSKDIVYYTRHLRAFVATASLNQTEIKGAFRSLNNFNEYFNRKTNVLMEQAKNEELYTISQELSKLLLPQNIGLIADENEITVTMSPKITLMGDDTKQADLVQYLQTYVNNIKFPALAKKENPLGLPLITEADKIVSFVTPEIITSQNFLEAYAFTANKITLPKTTEMMAPLPPVKLEGVKVDVLGTVVGVTDGAFTGTVVPIAFIADEDVLEVNRSEFYTDVEQNKLREFISPQVHDHFSVHPAYEKNIRFFAVAVPDETTGV